MESEVAALSQVRSAESGIGLGEKFSYGVGNFAEQMVFNPATSFIVFFYTDVVGLAAATVGAIFLLSRFFDLLNPVVGLVVDRTQTRFGKGRPWLLWLAVPFGISAVLMFTTPALGPTGKAVYAFLTYNLGLSIIFPAIDVPYSAMLPLVTSDEHERTLLSLFRMVSCNVGGLVSFGMTLTMVKYFGGGALGWNRSFMVFGAIGTLFLFICFAGTRERIAPVPSHEGHVPIKRALGTVVRNKYFLLLFLLILALFITLGLVGSNIYYCRTVLRNVDIMGPLMAAFQVSIIVGMLFANLLIKRLGKRKAAIWGLSVAVIGQSTMFLAPANVTLIYIGTILKGLGEAPMMGILYAMVADAVEYGEWKTGVSAGGLVFGAMALGAKVAIGVGNALVGFILGVSGYVAGAAVQSATAQMAIKAMFLHLPLLLFLVIGLILWIYDLDGRFPSIATDLKVRRATVS